MTPAFDVFDALVVAVHYIFYPSPIFHELLLPAAK